MGTAPWEGKQMWIWELDKVLGGSPPAIINAAKSMGLTGLLVKAWDSVNYWSQFDRIAAPARAVGLTMGAWGYSYGNKIAGEITAMERAVTAGADWLVIDAEIEYESGAGNTMANTLFAAIAASSSLSSLKLGYSSFGIPSYHSSFPWSTFSARCHAALPQVYWGDFNMAPARALAKCLSECSSYGLPVAPVGQSYGPVMPEEITAFGAAAKTAGCSGISFWSWQHATDAMLTAIKEVRMVPDVPTWKTEAVQWLYQKGLTTQLHDPLDDWDVGTTANVLRNLVEGDVLDNWAKDAWEKAVSKGIVDDTMPRGLVTREMLMVILDRLKLL